MNFPACFDALDRTVLVAVEAGFFTTFSAGRLNFFIDHAVIIFRSPFPFGSGAALRFCDFNFLHACLWCVVSACIIRT